MSNPNEDLATLRQCFPSAEKEVVRAVYNNCSRNFEAAYNALEAMFAPNLIQQQISISPHQKSSFLRAIFDKISPQFIDQVLGRWNMSVEGITGSIGFVRINICSHSAICSCLAVKVVYLPEESGRAIVYF